ncbi:MAG: hypothetical protein H6701_03595 [Myxococcales bacterium]|nr:hypothetical protein [Myxococcales bacterium]
MLAQAARMRLRDEAGVREGEVIGFHAGLDIDAVIRNHPDLSICALDGTRRNASVTRYDINLIGGWQLPRLDLSVRAFARLEQLSLYYDLPRAPGMLDAPPSDVAASTARNVYGVSLRITEWSEVTWAWLGAERPNGFLLARKLDGDGTVAEVPATDLAQDYILIGLGVPVLDVAGDLMIDPTDGTLANARLRVREAPLGESRFDVGVGWRTPEDQFYLSGDIWGLFGFLGAGLDIVPWEAELRSGWLGVGRRWLWSAGHGLVDESFASTPGLFAFAYLDTSLKASTYTSPATRAFTAADRLYGGELRVEAGTGLPPLGGFAIGLNFEVRRNWPQTLDAMPFLADRFEVVVGVTGRVGP